MDFFSKISRGASYMEVEDLKQVQGHPITVFLPVNDFIIFFRQMLDSDFAEIITKDKSWNGFGKDGDVIVKRFGYVFLITTYYE